MKDVSAGIIVRNGKIFIAQRPEGKPLPNVWEFPGGKDVDAEIGEFIMNTTYGYASGEFRINVYRVHIPDDAEPKLNVHQNAAWVTPAEMDNYEFPPADTDIIRHLKTVGL